MPESEACVYNIGTCIQYSSHRLEEGCRKVRLVSIISVHAYSTVPVPNKPTVSPDVKQHSTNSKALTDWMRVPESEACVEERGGKRGLCQ